MRKSTDAVKHVNTDATIFIAIGKIFWVENKTEKARRFLTRATELDGDNGDNVDCANTREPDPSAISGDSESPSSIQSNPTKLPCKPCGQKIYPGAWEVI